MKKPSLNIKRLEMPKLGVKMPSLGSKRNSSLRAPMFASDLYADLRDRRLLPLIALLLVAIVAAPILLSGGGGEDKAPPPLATSAVVPAQASFAVVPATPALRNYRERFRHRQARDPFEHPQSESSSTTANSSGEGTEASVGVTESTGGAPVEEGGGTTQTKVVIQKQVLGYQIDTKAGFVTAGPFSNHEGIAPMTQLPNKKNPLVLFVGPSGDKKKALFLMTENVTAFYGQGTCALKQAISCQLLALKPGQSATFAEGYGEARYKLYLKKIVAVEGSREAAATVTTGK